MGTTPVLDRRRVGFIRAGLVYEIEDRPGRRAAPDWWRWYPEGPFYVDGICYDWRDTSGVYLERAMCEYVCPGPASGGARMRADQPMTDTEIEHYLRTGRIVAIDSWPRPAAQQPSRVATSCGTCHGDVGLWDPPKLSSGYTHIRTGGGPHWHLNNDHEVSPTDYVPFPPSWSDE